MTGPQDKHDAANALANRIPRDQLDKLLALRAALRDDDQDPDMELARHPKAPGQLVQPPAKQ